MNGIEKCEVFFRYRLPYTKSMHDIALGWCLMYWSSVDMGIIEIKVNVQNLIRWTIFIDNLFTDYWYCIRHREFWNTAHPKSNGSAYRCYSSLGIFIIVILLFFSSFIICLFIIHFFLMPMSCIAVFLVHHGLLRKHLCMCINIRKYENASNYYKMQKNSQYSELLEILRL